MPIQMSMLKDASRSAAGFLNPSSAGPFHPVGIGGDLVPQGAMPTAFSCADTATAAITVTSPSAFHAACTGSIALTAHRTSRCPSHAPSGDDTTVINSRVLLWKGSTMVR